jgi:hypothetical protein
MEGKHSLKQSVGGLLDLATSAAVSLHEKLHELVIMKEGEKIGIKHGQEEGVAELVFVKTEGASIAKDRIDHLKAQD